MTSGPTQGHTCTFSIRSRLPITAFRLSHKSAVASVGNSHHHRKWQTLIASMVIDLRVQPATTVGGKRSSDTTTIDDHRIPRPSTVIVIRCGCAHRRSSTCVSTTIVSGNAHPSTVIDLGGQPTITASGKRASRPSTVMTCVSTKIAAPRPRLSIFDYLYRSFLWGTFTTSMEQRKNNQRVYKLVFCVDTSRQHKNTS